MMETIPIAELIRGDSHQGCGEVDLPKVKRMNVYERKSIRRQPAGIELGTPCVLSKLLSH